MVPNGGNPRFYVDSRNRGVAEQYRCFFDEESGEVMVLRLQRPVVTVTDLVDPLDRSGEFVCEVFTLTQEEFSRQGGPVPSVLAELEESQRRTEALEAAAQAKAEIPEALEAAAAAIGRD